MTTHQPIDVAIIGGGPAGYAAAIYAARSNLTTTVILSLIHISEPTRPY
mgnify:CR=1 FL=1